MCGGIVGFFIVDYINVNLLMFVMNIVDWLFYL